MLRPFKTRQFSRDEEKARRQKKDFSLLIEVMKMLIEEKQLPQKYCDHPLKGHWMGCRDCHVQNDWVLIYRVRKKEQLIIFERLGSHAELFN